MKKLLTFAVILFASCTVNADEIVLNVDFGTGNGVHSGAGVIGSAGDVWNGIGGGQGFNGAGTLDDPTGADSGIGVFRAGPENGESSGSFQFGSDSLGQDYSFITSSEPATFLIPTTTIQASVAQRFTLFTPGGTADGLDATKTYDLYLIGHGDQVDQVANFALKDAANNYTVALQTGRLFDGTYVEGENYSVFRDIAPTSFGGGGLEFDLYFFALEGSATSAGFNGIQLVERSSVPEPSSLALLSIAGLAGLIRRRRS